MRALTALGAMLALGACDPPNPPDPAVTVDAGPPQPVFDCADLETPPARCDDFNDGFDADWTVTQGDTWGITDAQYEGLGTQGTPDRCGASLISASVIEGFQAADVRIRARLTSVERNDAILVLRAVDESNRVELNFRAGDPDGTTFLADLAVQDLQDCVVTDHTDPSDPALHTLLPGNPRIGQPYDVVVELRGQTLRAWVNDAEVSFPGGNVFPTLPTASGRVGLGVIASEAEGVGPGRARFDDVRVEPLE